MADVFISYARDDRQRIQPLVEALEAEGFSVWWDPALVPGRRFRQTIAEELSRAAAVIVVWTRQALESDWVQDEAEEARQRGVLVPVLLEPVRPPAGFRQVQAADLGQWRGSVRHPEFRALVLAIRSLVQMQSPAPAVEVEEASDPAPEPVAAPEPEPPPPPTQRPAQPDRIETARPPPSPTPQPAPRPVRRPIPQRPVAERTPLAPGRSPEDGLVDGLATTGGQLLVSANLAALVVFALLIEKSARGAILLPLAGLGWLAGLVCQRLTRLPSRAPARWTLRIALLFAAVMTGWYLTEAQLGRPVVIAVFPMVAMFSGCIGIVLVGGGILLFGRSPPPSGADLQQRPAGPSPASASPAATGWAMRVHRAAAHPAVWGAVASVDVVAALGVGLGMREPFALLVYLPLAAAAVAAGWVGRASLVRRLSPGSATAGPIAGGAMAVLGFVLTAAGGALESAAGLFGAVFMALLLAPVGYAAVGAGAIWGTRSAPEPAAKATPPPP